MNSKRTVRDWTPLVSWEKLCECAAEEMAGFRWNWKGNMLWSFIECASSLKPSGELWETGVCKHSPQNNKTTANLYLLGARCFLTAYHWLGENHAWLRLKKLQLWTFGFMCLICCAWMSKLNDLYFSIKSIFNYPVLLQDWQETNYKHSHPWKIGCMIYWNPYHDMAWWDCQIAQAVI